MRMQRLLSLTPPDHPDHLSTFSLYHSTRVIVYVLYVVKAREEEYGLIKDIASSMDGLPLSAQLAKRERRLLWHGQIVLSTAHLPQDFLSARDELSARRRGGRDKTNDSGRREGKTVDLSCTTPQAFIFTDALILALVAAEGRTAGPNWRLLPRLGISRVVGIEGKSLVCMLSHIFK